MNIRSHVPFAGAAVAFGVAGWSLGQQSGPGFFLAVAAGIVFAEQAYRTNRKPAGQGGTLVFLVDEVHRPGSDEAFAENLADLARRSRKGIAAGQVPS